jgi:hypothetical protein
MYYWYRNGVYLSQYDGLQNLSSTATHKGEEWHVKVKPRDGKDFGNLVGVPVNVTIGNTAPSASSLSIFPSNPITGNDLTATYTFSDIDSDLESGTEIIWYLDGALQGILNGSLTVQAGNTSKNDEWHFKVRPYDGTDFGSWVSCPTNVTIGNTAPSVSNLAITPAGAKTANELTATYDFLDTDSGDSESNSSIRWFRNSIEQPSFENQTTIPSVNTSKGQTWYFIIIPGDGTDFGGEKTSAAILILNTAPMASNLAITPITPDTTTSLTASYTWSDVDNATDTESGSLIIWYKNGILQGALNNSNIVASSYIAKGEEWHFKVLPKDGLEFGNWVNCLTNVTVINSAPTVSGLSITPVDPKTITDLTASYTYTDVDSDTESGTEIIWYLDGALQGALNGSFTIAAGITAKGDDWHFKLRPKDGTDFGAWTDSTNVTIGNTVPTASNLAISPSTPKTHQTLNASYTFSDVDSDGEGTSQIRWYKNGLLQGALNDSLIVDPSYTLKGETWYFTITPYDGNDYGSLQQASAVVIVNRLPMMVMIMAAYSKHQPL